MDFSQTLSPNRVSVVVCTLNSIDSIESCLKSIIAESVFEVIVVDADSNDGTREIVNSYADRVLTDPRLGLGTARNIGIAESKGEFVLILGSDNVLVSGAIVSMMTELVSTGVQGIGALTKVPGRTYLSKGLNLWRKYRFLSGPASVVGSPTLFWGDQIRANPFNPERRYSDDTELCERWTREFGAKFSISSAEVLEIGKTGFQDLVQRCKIYGISDSEIYREGKSNHWTLNRKIRSYLHPLKCDFIVPLLKMKFWEVIYFGPYLLIFTLLRYFFWVKAMLERKSHFVVRET